MNIAHSAAIRVFCGEREEENEVVNGLKPLLPFDIEKEKIAIQRHNALGFGDRKIAIFEVGLTKSRHVKAFLDSLLPKISVADRQMLLRQLDSRIDDEANFFIRFEKDSIIKHNDLLVTDSGNCYHVKIKIATYPSNKEKAIEVAKKLLSN